MGQLAFPVANRIAAMSAPPAIVLNGIAVAFGMGAKAYRAVEHVDLTVGAQEFDAIFSPTGCGKSRLLNVVAGLQSPAAGTAILRGKPVAGISPQAGYFFQADTLMPWKTALANAPRLRAHRKVNSQQRALSRIGFDNADASGADLDRPVDDAAVAIYHPVEFAVVSHLLRQDWRRGRAERRKPGCEN